MSPEQTVELARRTLETTLLIAAPVLLIATIVSLLINIGQVLTSLQEQTLSTVPRLAAVAGSIFVLMPWIVRRMMTFTITLFSDFSPYLR